jgi:hypothetical protein
MVIMKSFKYVVYREGEYFVSQCLNLDIASFGTSGSILRQSGLKYLDFKKKH